MNSPESAQVDTQSHATALGYMISAGVWMVIGTFAGITAGIELIAPDLLGKQGQVALGPRCRAEIPRRDPGRSGTVKIVNRVAHHTQVIPRGPVLATSIGYRLLK